MAGAFDCIAADYDGWYDEPEGRAGRVAGGGGRHRPFRPRSWQGVDPSPQMLTELADRAGFMPVDARSTLFWAPGETLDSAPRVEVGVVSGAGFVGLLFEKK